MLGPRLLPESFLSGTLACPGCTFGNPHFYIQAAAIGSVPASYFLLRRYVSPVSRTWGWPRLSSWRLVSLALFMASLLPLAYFGLQHFRPQRVAACILGMAACVVYLWVRACWLLDQHRIQSSPSREILFPGVLGPCLPLLGLIGGASFFMLLQMLPFGMAGEVVSVLVAFFFFATPVYVFVQGGLAFVFEHSSLTGTRRPGAGEAATVGAADGTSGPHR